jgi:hypothetical protein
MNLVLLALGCMVGPPAGEATPEAPFGWLHLPAFTVDELPRPPLIVYGPQPGDVLFFDDHDPLWQFGFNLARAGRPMHTGMVIRMPDGQLGSLEAGYDDTVRVRVVPLAWRLHTFSQIGTIWVRRRQVPLTPDQDRELTAFGMAATHHLFAVHRLLFQVTPITARGRWRTKYLGKPKGLRGSFMCSELVIEALVHVGLMDAETARPSATFTCDLFFDASRNPYLNQHCKLAPAWEAPQMWWPRPDLRLLD